MSEVTLEDVESEEECVNSCSAKFCHGVIYLEDKKLCKCLLCTGPLKE